jgi:radical SAM superfamily enzyme YgiQ (UPF0313 family)
MFRINIIVFEGSPIYDSEAWWVRLGYVVSALKKLKNADIIISQYNIAEIEKAIADTIEKTPKIISLQIHQNNLRAAEIFAERIRCALPDVHITLGNTEASAFPETIMERFRDADSVIIGEGEDTFSELAIRLMNDESLAGCNGLYYRDGGVIRRNEMRALEEDLDRFNFPFRRITPIKFPEFFRPYTVLASRGCQGHCTFCHSSPNQFQPGRRVRFRSIKNVLDEVEYLLKEYGANYILFKDGAFEDGCSVIGERYEELYEGIAARKLNIRFWFQSRAETIDSQKIDILKKLVTVGLDSIYIGCDGGNEEDLKLYGKRAGMNDNIRAIKLLDDAGISFFTQLIMFNPYTTFDGLYQNIESLQKIAALPNALFTCDTILTRLMLCTGLPINRKISNDGLMDQNEGNPFITNGFGYRFKDKRVAEAWNVLNTIVNVPIDSHTLNMCVSMSNYFSFHRNPWRTHPLIMNYKTALKEYRVKSSSWLLSYVTKVIQQAEKGEINIINSFGNEQEKLIGELKAVWKKVEKCKFSVAALLRTNSTSKKILIIKPSFKPPKGFGVATEYPIGMAYVLACLEENNLSFHFIDLENSSDWVKDVTLALEQNNYYAIATGGLIGFYFFFQQLVSLIRKINPNIPVILGGNIVKDSSDQLLFETIGIDFGIIGEAEIAFPLLLKSLQKNDEMEFTKIPNLAYKNKSGEFVRNRQKRIDLTAMNLFPAWHHFDMSYYINKALLSLSQIGDRRTFMPVITGRGCVGKCTFCSPTIGGFRKRPISDVINEIKMISSKYDFDYILFQNEVFYPDVKSIREFCQKYIESGITVPWAAFFRIDSNLDVDTFLLMKKAGCLEIMGGLESGSETILKRMRKRITPDQIRTFFNNAKQANLRAWGDFIIGSEGETEEDIKKTIDLLIELDLNSDGTLLYVYPGTEVYKNALEKGIIKDELSHLEKVTRLIANMYSPYLKRDVFNVTSMSDSDFVDVTTRELRRYLTYKYGRNQIVDPSCRMYRIGPDILMGVAGKCRNCGHTINIIHKITSGNEYLGVLGDGVNSRFLCVHCLTPIAVNVYNCTKTTNLKEYFNILKKKISLYERIILIGANRNTSLMLRIDLFGIDYTNILGVFDIAGNFEGEYFHTLPVLNQKDVNALKPDCLFVTDCTIEPAQIKQLFFPSDNGMPEIVFLADDITRGKIKSLMKRIASQDHSEANP